ncbi:MAG TPA: glycerate kinase [Desulfuromonadales bacterium]|nr:glycerate kinase [Desulfuromonadales bacterium]
MNTCATDPSRIRADLESIFLAGVARVDPERLIREALRLDGSHLAVATDHGERRYDLDRFERIIVLGAGKATAKMARAVEEVLGRRIADGVISVKYGHTETLERIRTIEAGHPLPDDAGVRAAREITELATAADCRTLAIVLISGGGSALMAAPAVFGEGDEKLELTLEDKQAVTRALLSCGATIAETNCIRKHLSRIKGGRLAALLYPATTISLILSDVVGDPLDAIASGPTVCDHTSFADAAGVIARYDIADKIPRAISKYLDLGGQGRVPETPKVGDAVFERVENVLVGTNSLALEAARAAAESRGYRAEILRSPVVGEARDAARGLYGIAKDAHRRARPGQSFCLIAGGETTVTLHGGGKGGRNQEMALAFLVELAGLPEPISGIYFLSASTDGDDGPTDAAGAFADDGVLAAARAAGLDLATFLEANDSYPFFERISFLLRTGPTNTNVCDIHLIALSA